MLTHRHTHRLMARCQGPAAQPLMISEVPTTNGLVMNQTMKEASARTATLHAHLHYIVMEQDGRCINTEVTGCVGGESEAVGG